MSVESSFAELIAPDIMMPVQWYAGIRREDSCFHGTKQLMLAVLVDALQCLQTGARGRTAIRRQAFAETEVWIADRKGRGPFAFETVCETLGINPDWLRESLGEWRRQRLSGNNSQRRIRHSATTRSGPIRSSIRRRRRNAKEVALVGQQG